MYSSQTGTDTGTSSCGYVIDKRFRANPAYEVVVFDRLSARDRRRFAGLTQDPNLFGVLRPVKSRAPGLSVKAIDRETALLLYVLMKEPGPLPAYMKRLLGGGCNSVATSLVLDGVLEVEVPGGGFVSGPSAVHALVSEAAPMQPTHPLHRLSLLAGQYGQALNVRDAPMLASCLYSYNRLPNSRRWQEYFGTSQAVVRHLGLVPGSALSRCLDGYWRRRGLGDSDAHWFYWELRASDCWVGRRTPYKLYISPRPDYMDRVLPVLVETLTRVQSPGFKVGCDLINLLRPDKLVAYFHDPDQLHETARQLGQNFEGVVPQGVPFTAAITDGTILSWGVDPPPSQRVVSWQGNSWRRWITDRLAVGLLAAKRTNAPDVEPWRYAFARLSALGVDTANWLPELRAWDEGVTT